eukprot:TRINITY_DN587_c0_g1_i1.p1 TRINITY_DN587_c0_g1~~TRINITY_DN587_c0_g1_i1.p1  ORF type:complete len:160 (+),score=18.25 TRINITY_DN587_c0_g1_i1:300-779(+)
MQEISEDDKVTTLQIWDTAGAERFSSLGRVYYRGADCCLLVFDVSVPRTIDSLKFWKSEFQQFCGASEDFPFIVLANKVDREDRCISNEEIQSWCSENGLSIVMETSSKTGQNVELAFIKAVKMIQSKHDITPTYSIPTQSQIDLREQPETYDDDNCSC